MIKKKFIGLQGGARTKKLKINIESNESNNNSRQETVPSTTGGCSVKSKGAFKIKKIFLH